MNRSTIRTAGVALAAAAAATAGLLTAPAASAVPSTVYYQQAWTTVSGAPGTYVSGTAHCPAGTVVVGGGAANGVLLDTQPRSDGTGYYAAGQIPTTGPQYLSIEAVCAPRAQFAKSTTQTLVQRVHTHSARFGSTVTCAAGTTAYSAGISLNPKGTINDFGSHYGVSANFPRGDGRSWTLAAGGDTDNYDATIRLRCVPTRTRPAVTVHKTYPATAANHWRAGGYASCPAGYKPYAGGAWWSRPGESVSRAGGLTASYSTHLPDGWWASGPAYATDATLHVLAECS